MCQQIRHTLLLWRIISCQKQIKTCCESAIFYNVTSKVIYSVCEFDYYYNTTVTPSVIDGGSPILLANMLSPKRLVCSQDFHMAHPVPSFPYVLVNRSLLCNFHLESDLTYLLESLGSCSPSDKFTMYFTINSAFNHYMSVFGLQQTDMESRQLLTLEHIFDIFLNDTSQWPNNKSKPNLPLKPPKTLLQLFQSISSRSPLSPNLPFFPYWAANQ